MQLPTFNTMLSDDCPCAIYFSEKSQTYTIKRFTDGEIETVSKREFETRLRAGRIKQQLTLRPNSAAAAQVNMDLSAFSDKDIEIGLKRADYCRAILAAGEPSPQSGDEYGEIIQTVAKQKKEKAWDWKTVAGWVREYKAAAMDFRVLIPRNYRKGRKTIERPIDEQKVVQEFIDEYLTEERPVRARLYGDMRVRYHQEQKKNPLAISWKLMARSSFYEMLDRLDRFEVTRRRYGKEVAKTMFLHGGNGPVAEHPLDIVEVDATEADVDVWNDEMTAVIGRPWVYVAVDRCTRMVVGIYIGFEPPSAYSLLQCVKNGVEMKDWLQEEFPDIPVSWDSWGAWLMMVSDNSAEALGNSLKAVLGTMGTEHRLAPIKTPEFKAIVERFLKTFNEDGTARLQGKTFNNVQNRGNYLSSEKAVLTISQFRYFIHYWLLVDYCYAWHDGLGGVPAHFWKDRIRNYQPRIPSGIENMDGLFGELHTATLDKTGLTFLYLQYKSAYLSDLHYKHGNVKLSFKVDPVDLGMIYVVDPDTKALRSVPCDDPAYSSGLTLHQHKKVLEIYNKSKADWENSDLRLEMRAKLIAWTQHLLTQARATAKKAKARLLKQGVVQPGLKRRGAEALGILVRKELEQGTSSNPFAGENTVDPADVGPAGTSADSMAGYEFFDGGRDGQA